MGACIHAVQIMPGLRPTETKDNLFALRRVDYVDSSRENKGLPSLKRAASIYTTDIFCSERRYLCWKKWKCLSLFYL
jgi:hypothetical protein